MTEPSDSQRPADAHGTQGLGDPIEHDFTGPLSPPVKKLLRVFFALCALLLLADFVVHRHTYHDAEKLPGFYGLYGFVGCVVLVLVAKEMRKLVIRPEDYYDPPAESAGESRDPRSGGAA